MNAITTIPSSPCHTHRGPGYMGSPHTGELVVHTSQHVAHVWESPTWNAQNPLINNGPCESISWDNPADNGVLLYVLYVSVLTCCFSVSAWVAIHLHRPAIIFTAYCITGKHRQLHCSVITKKGMPMEILLAYDRPVVPLGAQ